MEDLLSRDEMPAFLNELAVKTEDEETKWKLLQCSIFIHNVNYVLDGKEDWWEE